MKILLVGGTWDLNKGKQSGLVEKMYNILSKTNNVTLFNGGDYNELEKIILTATEYEVIFWMAFVPNELPKVRYIKTINPHAIVIGSKRNDNSKYSFVEILNRSLEQRNNLTIEFSKHDNGFKMLVFDPLGTNWYEGFDLNDCFNVIQNRLLFLLQTRREHTFKTDKNIQVENNEAFFEYTRECSEIFHNTIEHADGITRFLGNSSFRGNNGIIYVTRRDVDKRYINKENFVAAYLENEKVYYSGDFKPSKDTVVQTRLYELLPNINYIVHTHCYAEGGFFTENPVPCGALDEIDEVLNVIKNNYNNNFNLDYYKINLIGHGCLIFGNNIEAMKQTKYITRHLPEKL